MTHVEIEETVAACAADVWDCFVGSRGEELAIGIYAESVTTQGHGQGSIRTSVLLGGAGIIREQIDVFDDENFVCCYRVLERGPLPYGDYRGRITLKDLGPASCRLKLEADFTPIGVAEDAAVALYLQNNHAGIARMKELLNIGSSA